MSCFSLWQKNTQQERIEELTEQMNNNIIAYKNDPEEEMNY